MSDEPLSLFREACGAAGDIDLEVTDVAGGEVYRQSFPRPFVVAGRHAKADLVLADDEVSQRHAYLQMIGGRLWCLDLDSRTGVTWDDAGRRADWLTPSRSIRIGTYWIRNLTAEAGEGGPAAPDPRESLPDEHDALPSITLEFLNAARGPTLWQVNRILTLVGRSPSCKVQLECPSVGKFHCSLLRSAQGLWVTDLLGGVIVNGQKVRWARLSDRDQMWIGRYLVRVHYDLLPRAGHSSWVNPAARRNDGPPPGPKRPVVTDIAAPPDRHGRAIAGPAGDYTAVVTSGLGVAEPALALLVSQFAQMQQHMVEQFQQALLSVVKAFGNLHRDQMALVREELGRLHELTSELHALRNELSDSPPAAPPPPAARAGDVTGGNPGQSPPTAENRPRANGKTPGPAENGPAASPPGAGAPTNGRSKALPSLPPERQPTDVHTWLQKRFDVLQRERQNRWQKLLAFLRRAPGESGPSGDPAP
jgi:pSer/pThr/pTyr-binding forkhead associated (FHA) protein